MSEIENKPAGRHVKHWKSLEEWRRDPEFERLAQDEFLSSPLAQESSEVARRDFLKLMGASLALSSAGCIRRPAQKIIPYVKRPPEMIMGVANYYTSSWIDNGEAFGLIVKTREGRPIKIEGNPEHPINQGGTTARAQAHVLSLYDPDRLSEPRKNLHNEERSNRDTISATWKGAEKEIVKQLGQGDVVVLTSTLASPSTRELIEDFCRAFGGRHVVYDAFGADDLREAQNRSYGDSVLPRYRFDKSQMTVSLGADFLGTFLSPAEFTRQFSKTRKPGEGMSRLVVFEAMMSLTGSNADERFVVKPSQYLDVVMALIGEIIGQTRYASDDEVRTVLASFAGTREALGVPSDKIKEVAQQLWAHRGRSLVLSGGLETRNGNSIHLHTAVGFLNHLLENDGQTIDAEESPMLTQQGSHQAMRELIADMQAGKVKTLISFGANPAYTLPKSSGFIASLKKVPLTVNIGHGDEMGLVSDFMLPAHHEMENWSDAEFQRGVFSIQQPTVRPLHNSKSFQDLLIGWMKAAGQSVAAENWYAYLRAHWRRRILGGADFEAAWDEALQKGVVVKGVDRESSGRSRRFNLSSFTSIQRKPSTAKYELSLYAKVGLGDGRYANLSWLQELPDPVTKIVWDNYLNVSVQTAKELGLSEGDVVKVSASGQSLEAPVHIQPGVHDKVFALAVGYGRWGAGKVATGVGVNAYDLVDYARTAYAGLDVKIEKTRRHHQIANTQGHHTMFGRPIAMETTNDEYKKNPKAGQHKAHFEGTIWADHKYKGHKWGMVIDTNACTGCSACVTACQAENNTAVVGKKYVLQGREMHWIRIDRYYSEHPENPETVHQAMICQHCDNAPCETVCPVVATSHSDEGLNEMTYNRCVGTRYCANNCPYKVRRFNWFSYMKYREPEQMVLNPEVMVRSRGVMEKCSFCVQRIKEAKNVARDEKRPLQDGEVKVACEQACPAQAIVFGDTNDADSRVAQGVREKRSYVALEDINVKPAVHYMTKVRHREPRKDQAQGGHH